MTGNDTIVLASKVFMNTNLAAAVATVVTMILTWVKYSKPDVSIRKMANWSAEDNWNIPGIYFAEDDALVYDVSAAYRPSPKGGWTVKRQKEEAAAAALAGNSVADDSEEVDD